MDEDALHRNEVTHEVEGIEDGVNYRKIDYSHFRVNEVIKKKINQKELY